MRVSQFIVNINVVFILCGFSLLQAQPEFRSKAVVEGIVIFHDKTDPLLYYYEPGDLILDTTENGAPDLRFLDMRYTGTKCYNDTGEKRFKSLLQFGVIMQKIDANTLKRIKAHLKKGRHIKLKPLPISHINTRLVLPIEAGKQNYETIDDDGALEATGKAGFTSSKSFWTKRTYTVALNKYEAQLVNNQLQQKLLGLSLSYSYHANVLLPNEEDILGSEALKTQFERDSIAKNTPNIQNRTIKGHNLTIKVDVEKFPKTITQIDLNEEMPPTYAGIEVKCHDFKENLRPELYMKTVEVEAISVNNDAPIYAEIKFLSKHPTLFTQHINFPYAVNMNFPMRYRITEIHTNGERKVLEWQEKPECFSIIDVTSTSEEQHILSKIVDVEIDRSYFKDDVNNSIEFELIHTLNSKKISKTLVFNNDDHIPLQSLRYKMDKNSEVYYNIKQKTEDGMILVSDTKEVIDDYIFINTGI